MRWSAPHLSGHHTRGATRSSPDEIAPMHLAEFNVARTLYPLDHPEMADFVAQLDSVNALADADPGFVWRLKSDAGGASSYVRVPGDELLLVNLSLWRSVESLKAYVYRSHGHSAVFRDRRRWFEAPTEAPLAMWWIPEATIPTVEEGFARLAHLRLQGPSAYAFTFKALFPAPEARSELVSDTGNAPSDLAASGT